MMSILGMLLALPVPVKGGYVLRETGNCNGCEFIHTSDQCELAARELALNGVNVNSASKTYNPYGCYYREGNAVGERLYFNPNGDRSDSDTTRVSICVQTETSTCSQDQINYDNDDDDGEPPSVDDAFITILIVTTAIPVVIMLIVLAVRSQHRMPFQRNVHAQLHAQHIQRMPMQQVTVTPTAQPSPVALPPVARPVVAAPAPTWTPPTPATSTAMSSGAGPPAYAACMGTTLAGTEDMFNADGTFK